MGQDEGLHALGAEVLRAMSLETLKTKMNKFAEDKIPQSEISRILMVWFNEQIKQDAFTQDGILLKTFLKLLLVCHRIDIENDPFALEQMGKAFEQWLSEEAASSPMYTRRYLIAQKDVDRLLREMRTNLQGSVPRPPSDYRDEQRDDDAPILPRAEDLKGMNIRGVSTRKVKETGQEESFVQNWSSKPTKSGRKTKSQASACDVSVPPPTNYLCKRCNEPGHWIQLCPTNIDPDFDLAPCDYYCKLCGRRDAHFSAFCPQNSHELSLAQRRKRTSLVDAPHRQLLTKEDSHYRDRESSRRQSPGHSRSRSPGRRRSHSSKSDGDDSADIAWTCRVQRQLSPSQGESYVPPYTANARLSRRRRKYRDLDKNKKKDAEFSYTEDLYTDHGPTTATNVRQGRALGKTKRQRNAKLDNARDEKTTKGRLAYDDVIYEDIGADSSASSPLAAPLHNGSCSSSKRAEALQCIPPSAMVDSPDIDDSHVKCDEFLRALSTEFLLGPLPRGPDTDMNSVEPDMGNRTAGIRVETDNASDTADEIEEVFNRRLIKCPPFSPKVVSMFQNRENAIINRHTNRKTAWQMIELGNGKDKYSSHKELVVWRPQLAFRPPTMDNDIGGSGKGRAAWSG
ncbi:hypothetical protein GGS20DRAFT_589877 [Poronia punctata]|nr:hypothetical protein GGS20DRAFT_589877 [Poronia punctata]